MPRKQRSTAWARKQAIAAASRSTAAATAAMTGASPTASAAAAAGGGPDYSRDKKEETPRPLLQALVPKDWRNGATAIAFLLFGIAVVTFLPDMKLLIKRVLNMESL